MTARLSSAAVAAVLWVALAGASEVRLTDPGLPGFRQPLDLAPIPGDGVAVLEDLSRAVTVTAGGGRLLTLPGLERPRALAVDEEGLLLVVDQVGSGLFLVAFRGTAEAWRVPLRLGEDLEPVDAEARNGILWLLGRAPPRLHLVAFDGASLASVDLKGRARAPFSVALGAAGEGFIVDPMGPALLVFSPAGAYLGDVALEGTGVTRPTGIAAAPTGLLWISDGVTGRVTCLTSGRPGKAVRCLGSPLQLEDPLRLRWAEGVLWVLEGKAGRLRKIEVMER